MTNDFCINQFFRYRTPDSRIARIIAVVSHEVVRMPLHRYRQLRSLGNIQSRVDVRLRQLRAIDPYFTTSDLDLLPRQTNQSLNITFGLVQRIPKDPQYL